MDAPVSMTAGLVPPCTVSPLKPGSVLGNLHLNKHRRLHSIEYVVCILKLADVVLFEPLGVAADEVGVYLYLLIGFRVHEVVDVSVVIEILHLARTHVYALELRGLLEVLFVYATRADVAILRADVRVSLAGLYVLGFQDDAVVALDVYAKSNLQVGDAKCCHVRSLSIYATSRQLL